jgi:hypothetical protein
MKIDRKRLFELYMGRVNHICDQEEQEFRTHFTAEECVNMVCDQLEKNPDLIHADSSYTNSTP